MRLEMRLMVFRLLTSSYLTKEEDISVTCGDMCGKWELWHMG